MSEWPRNENFRIMWSQEVAAIKSNYVHACSHCHRSSEYVLYTLGRHYYESFSHRQLYFLSFLNFFVLFFNPEEISDKCKHAIVNKLQRQQREVKNNERRDLRYRIFSGWL